MPASEETLTQLKQLVGSHKVVLFMKGNRHFPQCGFSSTVVGILNKLTLPYETVNVLADPAVREGIKELSSWPTIPQLYVHGEFVGGCDIVKDMFASGALHELLGVEAAAPTAPRVPTITVTPAAAKAFAEAAEGDDVLRLAIDGRFENDLSFGAREQGDVEVKSGALSLFLDPASALRADGVSIDFVSGPQGAGFKIVNPNEPPRVRSLSVTETKAMLDAGTLRLFDVRPDAERALAKIDAATKLDAGSQAALLALPKDTHIAFHCHHGGRSRAAAEALVREGFRNVYNVEGGIDAWTSSVDPSVPRY
jgi:monothiol glutaredoxin